MLDKWRLLKTLSWRAVAIATTAVIAYVLTGSISITTGIVGAELLIKIILFYIHEYAWDVFHVKKMQRKNQR